MDANERVRKTQHKNIIPGEFLEPNWRLWSFILILVLGIYLLGVFRIGVVDGLTDPWYSPTVLVIPFVGLFRLTCYAYRKDYHRHLFDHPQACLIGFREDSESRHYSGETGFFRLENFHRYFMYIAVVILPFFFYDFYISIADTSALTLGGLIILINAIMVTIYTFSCHAIRHLVGGRKDCFSCPASSKPKGGFYRFQSALNSHHEAFAWTSLALFFFVDLYIRAVAAGVITNISLLR
ncbi:MAG: succinate dehydrogenase [Candidatus Thermoplasmatota archaeon]|nr:succinate dehydrogenase [Candidatus Thermoplasmatota archaeon]